MIDPYYRKISEKLRKRLILLYINYLYINVVFCPFLVGAISFSFTSRLTMNFKNKNKISDEELLLQLKNNDVDAFTELYERYWDRMVFLVLSKLKNPKEAEEIVQDIFVSLWSRRQSLDITGRFSAYIATAVKYRIINAIAREKRVRQYHEIKMHVFTEASNCTEDKVLFDDLEKRLAAKIKELPEKGRLAFNLSRQQGLSHKEIAGEMNITEKAVERNIARSVKALYLSMRHLLQSI